MLLHASGGAQSRSVCTSRIASRWGQGAPCESVLPWDVRSANPVDLIAWVGLSPEGGLPAYDCRLISAGRLFISQRQMRARCDGSCRSGNLKGSCLATECLSGLEVPPRQVCHALVRKPRRCSRQAHVQQDDDASQPRGTTGKHCALASFDRVWLQAVHKPALPLVSTRGVPLQDTSTCVHDSLSTHRVVLVLGACATLTARRSSSPRRQIVNMHGARRRMRLAHPIHSLEHSFGSIDGRMRRRSRHGHRMGIVPAHRASCASRRPRSLGSPCCIY